MDPNATLQRIIEAAQAGDVYELLAATDDLVLWLREGGFAPTSVYTREETTQ